MRCNHISSRMGAAKREHPPVRVGQCCSGLRLQLERSQHPVRGPLILFHVYVLIYEIRLCCTNVRLPCRAPPMSYTTCQGSEGVNLMSRGAVCIEWRGPIETESCVNSRLSVLGAALTALHAPQPARNLLQNSGPRCCRHEDGHGSIACGTSMRLRAPHSLPLGVRTGLVRKCGSALVAHWLSA
jgi:hypothetical protein